MHRIESNNEDISQGKNMFKDGPPGTTVNAAIMNAVQEEICNAITGGGLTLKTKMTDTHDQLNTVISSLANKNGRAATYIYASSDSSARSQLAADQVIHTSADAAAIIKAKAAELSALGGGSILCLDGTFNCYTELDWSSYVDLRGCGYSTVFKRMAAVKNLIDNSVGQNCNFDSFRIDGNKASFVGVNYINLLGNAPDFTSNYKNIISHDCGDFGFRYCTNMLGCVAYSNTVHGFDDCDQITNCYSYSNTQYGFNSCKLLTNCYAYSNVIYGFYSCERLVSCLSESNSDSGFIFCTQVSNCYSYSNNRSGFVLCKQLVSCKSTNNAVSAYHYTSCWPMQQCVGASGGSAWRSCFADHGGAVAVADTAAGGYNLA